MIAYMRRWIFNPVMFCTEYRISYKENSFMSKSHFFFFSKKGKISLQKLYDFQNNHSNEAIFLSVFFLIVDALRLDQIRLRF